VNPDAQFCNSLFSPADTVHFEKLGLQLPRFSAGCNTHADFFQNL
jgi:hypothetical protein